ncbi:MAG: glycosyltransferase family 2 protein, partial [Paludibacter sp.]
FRNNLLLLYKNLPDNLLKKIMMSRFFFDYAAAFQLFITGKPRNAFSVFKARRDYHGLRSNFKEKRKENILNTVNNDISEILQKSIVFNYYLKGKKTFNSLEN